MASGWRGPSSRRGGLLHRTRLESGHVEGGHFATWNFSAFQHGGMWDVKKVCCVTIFSYRRRLFSTSLGNGEPQEGAAGYLVEFGK